jgi:hypothetical protein
MPHASDVMMTEPAGSWISQFAELVGALAWPALALGAFALLAWTKRGRFITSQLTGRLGRVDAFGLLSLEFTAEASQRVKAGIDSIFDEYRRDEETEFEKLVAEYELSDKLVSLVIHYIAPSMSNPAKGNFRCTMYVPDLVFKDGLYQLLDYYPHDRRGAGRVIANRFGHVGRAFRAEESVTDGRVTTDPDLLVKEYGMTKDEVAEKAQGRRSFSCVILKRASYVVGGIYVDAEESDAFVPGSAAFQAEVTRGAEELSVTKALDNLTRHIRRSGLHLDIMRRPE